MKKLSFVIIDRDGVINYDSHEYIKSPDEWIPIPGSLEAIASLNHAGFRVMIATNQSGVARQLFTLETLQSIHEKLKKALLKVGGKVDDIFFCPHHPDDQCECRKPNVGLFTQIKEKYEIDFSHTFFIGDSSQDVEVALKTGCKPLLVLTGNGEKTRKEYPSILHFNDLAAAAAYIINEGKNNETYTE
jgi:D-glycero-D-manno-heptose 1,7-bisphosphate phosphatase